MTAQWCECPEPFRDPSDEHEFCWRCGLPIQAIDADTGEGLGYAEDEEPE